jgi:hypothetical protein
VGHSFIAVLMVLVLPFVTTFHDYGGTLLIVAWLFSYWIAMKRWILVDPASEELEVA